MENKKKTADHRKTLLEWDAPEFIPYRRGKVWYLVAGAIMGSFILYALFSGSITMALAFLMIMILFMIIERRKPRTMKVRITDMGVEYDGHFYSFHQINAFWIVYHPPLVQVLYLRVSEGKQLKNLKIELDEQDPVALRKLLIQEIPEMEGASELTVDMLARILRIQ
ncbi:MAG: hypothetical protein OEY44_02615 [Candidatus Peregrinibacteria bacterium]|nr:hypothetical protein [Candidatus Peregrinibacteria bacterium]